MDRRTYLRQMALVSGGALVLPHILVSCGDELKHIDLSSTMEPFKTLEEVRHFVRLSKGHLKLEVQRLIKKKDSEAIFNFVNKRIASIPGHSKSITSNAYEIRYGRNGVLRCGKGTLREKSDLLFYMLSEAGFEPTYHRANFLMTPALVNGVFCRTWSNNNVIEVDEAYLDKWEDTLSPTDNGTVAKSIDIDGGLDKQLSDELVAKLPAGFESELPHVDWLDIDGLEAPIVRVKVDGDVRDLNFVEDKEFSEFREYDGDLFDLSIDEVNSELDKVRVIVRATFSDNINKPLELVRGEWELEDLLGNQIALQCMPTMPQEILLQSQIKDIQQFVPVLSLVDPEIPKEEKISHSFKGVGFDLMGNTFQEDGDGAIRMNGLKLNEIENPDTNRVKSLKIELLENEYPSIKLKCLPLDEKGKPVLGLSGASFEVVDQNEKQFPVVLQNSLTTRILIFFDSTASMPYPYAANDIPEETIELIHSGFERIESSVVFETKMFQLEFLKDLSRLELKKYDHTLCIGDGEAFDKVTSAKLQEVIGDNSISYHYVKNGSSRQSSEQVRKCFSEANYPFYEIESLENDIAQIGSQLANNARYPYLLSYEAPFEGDDMIHPVSVGITNNENVALQRARYIVDRERAYDQERYPCGISIMLEWDKGYSRESITKHVAGFNSELDDATTNRHKEEVRAFALGTHRFFFESDKATLPVLLDESLSAQLSVAPFFEDPKEMVKEQIEQINEFRSLPSAGLSIFAPLPEPEKDLITFENNFQTCFYSEFVNFDHQKSYRKVDVWETSDVRTFAASKKESFRRTLQATSLLALSESVLFGDSTFEQLKAKLKLVYSDGAIDFASYPEWRTLGNDSYLNYLIYDASLDSQAYWKIRKSTGALIGIMPDGSGGGIEAAVAHNLKIIDSYAGAYNKAAAPLMSDPLAFGTVTMYGQFLARLYGLVCVAVISLDAAKLPADSRKALKKLAYGVIKSFAFAKFGKLKQFEKILDKLFDPGWPKIKK